MENHQFPPRTGIIYQGHSLSASTRMLKSGAKWFSLGNQQLTGKGVKISFLLGFNVRQGVLVFCDFFTVKHFSSDCGTVCLYRLQHKMDFLIVWTLVKEPAKLTAFSVS